VMDALALTLGVNLKIYRSQQGHRINLVHAYQPYEETAKTIEILHNPYTRKAHSANHFDLLESEPSHKRAARQVEEGILEFKEQSKTKVLLPMGTLISLYNNLREFQELTAAAQVQQDLQKKGYTQEEAKKAAHQVKEIGEELATADQEIAAAEEKAIKKIQTRKKIKEAAKQTGDKSSNQQAGQNLVVDSLLTEPARDYQDIFWDLAKEKQDIAQKHQDALATKSWHEGAREIATEAGKMLQDAAVGAINQALDDFSYIPSPIGIASATIAEGRDVYTGKTTVGEALVNAGIVGGKGVQLAGKGIKAVAKSAKPLYDKGKGILSDFTDYVAQKVGKSAKPIAREIDLETLKIGNWQIPKSVVDKIPENLGKPKLNIDGKGFRWVDKNGNGVRIDKGDPTAPFVHQRIDHVRIQHNGKTIGRDGKVVNPTTDFPQPKNNPEAHVPFSEWVKWKGCAD
jgi:hypothetical protein